MLGAMVALFLGDARGDGCPILGNVGGKLIRAIQITMMRFDFACEALFTYV